MKTLRSICSVILLSFVFSAMTCRADYWTAQPDSISVGELEISPGVVVCVGTEVTLALTKVVDFDTFHYCLEDNKENTDKYEDTPLTNYWTVKKGGDAIIQQALAVAELLEFTPEEPGEYHVEVYADDKWPPPVDNGSTIKNRNDPQSATKTATITALKVEFKKDEVVVCWSKDGTYDAKANLTDDSFDKDRLKWMIKKIEGVAALVDNDGKVTFGSGGGKYTITATSEDNVLCSDSFTLNVVELIAIEGSYADFVGEEKSGVKIYAAAENPFDSVIYEAEIFPKLTADELPYRFIRWEGFNILKDQLTVYRNKRNEDVKGTIVSATCGDVTKSARQHVLRTCKQPLKVVVRATVKHDDSIVIAGDFGGTDRNDAKISTDNDIWVYYIDSQGWHYDLRGRRYILRWGQDSRQRINVTLEMLDQSPFPLGYQMKETRYPTDKSRLLVAWLDFQTGILWPDGRTWRRHYWSSTLVERHELFHCTDWQPYYETVLFKADSGIDRIVHKICLNCLSYDAALDAKGKLIDANIQQAFDPANKAYKEGPRNKGHEVRAYADGKASYDALSKACKQSAEN